MCNNDLTAVGKQWRSGRCRAGCVRIEYPGAIYYVMSRDDRRGDNFHDEVDRVDFLKTVAECCQIADFQMHAYRLMRNHLHLGLDSGRPIAGRTWPCREHSGSSPGIRTMLETAPRSEAKPLISKVAAPPPHSISSRASSKPGAPSTGRQARFRIEESSN